MSKENTPTETTMTTNPAVGGIAPAASAAATAQPSAAQFLLYREAFEQALPASAEISDSELLPVNIDVPSAVATAVGALPKILAHRSEAAQLPGFDISHFDQLQLHTFAVGHAHAKFLAASTPPEELAALNERGMELRDTMYSDAVALAHRDLISGERIASFKANAGYKNLAFDLLGLSTLLRENWDKIAAKTAIQMSELDAAELLGRQLMDAVGAREQAPAVQAQVQAQRQRNFTLFSRSYDQVRRAISYLRWDDDDIDSICPSLYAGRGGGRRKEVPAPVPSAPLPDPAAPATGNAAPATAVPTAAAPSKAPAAAGVGLPNGDPFVTSGAS